MQTPDHSEHDHEREFDVVVFGASGFTGKYVAAYIATTAAAVSAELKRPLRWAIAGRSHARLEAVLAEHCGGAKVPVVPVDVFDTTGLHKLASSTRVLINCVGPFRFYGENVVQACVSGGANYVDITGEPEFIDRTYLSFDADAKSRNLTIVPACGFDSMPADLGVLYTRAKMIADRIVPASIDMYLSLHTGPAGFAAHFATFESAVQGFANTGALRAIRAQVVARRPRAAPVTSLRPAFVGRTAWHHGLGKYTLPFPGSDASVVRMGMDLVEGKPDALVPVHFGAYMAMESRRSTFALTVLGAVLSLLAPYKWGRWLLLKFPRAFTFGIFSHAGPTPAMMAQTSFSETFIARGYALPAGDDESRDHLVRAGESAEERDALRARVVGGRAPDTEFVARVTGPEPGYIATPVLVVNAAYTVLLEKRNGNGNGNVAAGVLTPASAFYRTSLIHRLKGAGIGFAVVSKKSLV
ncbi:hypothetical protein H9P43_001810 [Blastocladiella emersonii ATCC 22665]|nr:hypothetical protein H9P43_001810 [Blastocladiella emersonii ATCC 22665]